MNIIKNFAIPSKESLLCLMLLTIMSLATAIVIPPFQSPDEFSHVYRSYSQSHGTIVLEKNSNGDVGGYIDDSLLEYMKIDLREFIDTLMGDIFTRRLQ